METAYEQLNKKGEELCGDHVEIIRTPEFVLAVLADGLGSGVKANILATMTAKIISTMMSAGGTLEEVVETVASTLPVCSERGIAYSTFSIVQVFRDGRTYLAEYDNPPAVFMPGGSPADLFRRETLIAGKKIREVSFAMQSGDRLVIFSDGALHAGTGKILNMGWQHKDIVDYLGRSISPVMTSAEAALLLTGACDCLYQGQAGDDTTVLCFTAKEDMPCSIMIGPPEDPARDEEMVHAFLKAAGKKIICGGTTAQIVSRITGKKLDMGIEKPAQGVPPTSGMKGIDLVTEGIVTLGTAIEYMKWDLSLHAGSPFENEKKPVGGATGFNDKRQDGAAALAKLLMNECTQIHIFFGQAANPAYSDPSLPFERNMKLRLVNELKELLESTGKSVVIDYY